MKTMFALLAVAALTFTAAAARAGDDEPLNPAPAAASPTAPPAAMAGSTTGSKDLVDTAVAAGDFKTLAQALTAAGLIDTLKGPGPFTVFAPTDAAFAKVPKKALDKLLADKDQLKKVLLYHVVAGKVLSSEVVKLKSAKTVEGAEVKISANKGKVKIDKATVTKADIDCSNGVIHVIDSVLMPKK